MVEARPTAGQPNRTIAPVGISGSIQSAPGGTNWLLASSSSPIVLADALIRFIASALPLPMPFGLPATRASDPRRSTAKNSSAWVLTRTIGERSLAAKGTRLPSTITPAMTVALIALPL